MSLTNERLRDKLVPGNAAATEQSDALVETIKGEIGANEQIEYRLPGKNGIVREHNGGTDKIEKPEGGETLALVTSEQLLFVLFSPEQKGAQSISYTNVKSVDADEGLLRSKLVVDVWHDGEYRFKIADSENLAGAVHYIREAKHCWQRVISAVEDATELTQQMGAEIEEGSLDAARQAREDAMAKISRARQYLDRAEIDPPQTLRERINETAVENDRTEIRNRLTRAETLMTEAKHQTDAREYTAAYERYWYARDHLETARVIAREAKIPEPQAIESKLETIENRLRHLKVRPQALGQQAVERAEGTEKTDVEADAWQEAFEHYRDALTAGWGTDIDFSGGGWEIRMKIEHIVTKLIESRMTLAAEYEQAGNDLAMGQPSAAVRRYDEAIEQLEQAHQFASEFRAGDREEIGAQLDEMKQKRLSLR